jgi:thiamine transport system permease protein
MMEWISPSDFLSLPFADWVNFFVKDWLVPNFRPFFRALQWPVVQVLNSLTYVLQATPMIVFTAILSLLAWRTAGRSVGVFTLASLVFIDLIGLWSETMTTFAMVVTAVFFCVVIGIPLGVAAARSDLFERVQRPVLDVMQTIPSFVYLVPIVMLFGVGMVPGIIATIIFALPPIIRLTNLGIRNVRADLMEAATSFGATPWQVFRTVTLPSLRPAIVSAASVVFLFCATAFGIVLTLGGVRYASVETEIYLLTTDLLDLPAAAALSLVQLSAVVVLLVITGRLRRVPDPTVRRSTAPPHRPQRSDLPLLAVAAGVLVLVATPILSLVVSSVRHDGAWSLIYYRALTRPGSETGLGHLLRVPVTEALGNSLRIAVDAAAISLTLGLLVAIVVTRRYRGHTERRVRNVLDGLFMLPLGVSAVTLGFGFLITLDSPPLELRSSPLLVPIAKALVALPRVGRTLVPVLQGIDDRQRQAAASLGAGPLRALMTVDIPVLWRPLLAAAGFAFAVSLGEFGATSFIVRAETPTLPVVIFRLIGHPGILNHGTAMAASVVLAATTAAVILVVERLRVPALGTF